MREGSDDQQAPASTGGGSPPGIRDVGDFLAAYCQHRPDGLAEIGRGEWSVAYGYECDGAERVIRFGFHREDFEKDRVATTFAGAVLPIPRILDIGEAFDGFYAVSERARGRFLDQLDGEEMRKAMPALLRMLDAMRAADVSATTGYGPWDAEGRGPFATWTDALLDVANDAPSSRIHGWRTRMEKSSSRARWFDDAVAKLRALANDCPADRHLLHCDLLNRNVLVTGDRMSGVFDWGNAKYGDFLYEIAGITFWVPWFQAWRGIDFASEVRRHYDAIGLDTSNFEPRLACYEAQWGLDGCAYNAFRERWDDFEWTMRRTQAILAQT